MASSIQKFDCIVIGSGQSGTPLAASLAQSGRKTALIERSHIGGCCVNEGCTPTKTMIASGRVAYLASRAADYGVYQKTQTPAYAALRGPKDGEHAPIPGAVKKMPIIDMVKVRQRKRDIVDSFRSGSEARLKNVKNLEVVIGEASFTSAHGLCVKAADGTLTDCEAETFFINVGERPRKPWLQGLPEVEASELKDRILDSTSIQELDHVPEKLIVLGGGYIGMEFGQLFRRLGSKVTVVQRGKQLVPREDKEFGQAMLEICKDDGIEVIFNASDAPEDTIAVSGDQRSIKLTCNIDGTATKVEGSHILFAAGRTPNTDALNLDKAGIEVDKRFHIKVSPTLQTSIPHIYALGDCHGGPAFTHISYDDFRIIKANFIDQTPKQLSTTDRIVPYVMYTDPQLAHVGLHDHEARRQFGGDKVETASMPMSYVARALETDETRGLMKAVVHAETEQILGFTCLGLEGGEIMSIVQVAMMGGLKYTALQQAVFAHPTLAESLNNLWGFLK
ncbi:hypothetical protein LTR86_008161 [Recurvomyces mirabilis]|nr:hypothetical protein LTR86_008161 [Recurvomyces mirabilis]